MGGRNMKTLTILNSIAILCIIYWQWHPYFPFYIDVYRTSWMKKIISFTLMRKTSKHSAKGIFGVRIRNYEKWNKWDSEQFHNGNYKKLKCNQ